jgi:putative transposase
VLRINSIQAAICCPGEMTDMKMNFASFSSSYGKMELHICFKVKYCHEIFVDPKVQECCAEAIFEASKKCNTKITEMGFDKNHVHMDIILSPEFSISDFAKQTKGYSAKVMMEKFPYLRKEYFWGGNLWNPSYYFDSVGDANSDQITYYVRNQGKKDSREEEIVLPPENQSAGQLRITDCFS